MEKHHKSLSVNACWAVLGNIFHSGSRFLIYIIIIKYFTSDRVGQFDYALAIATPLAFLINMELRTVLVTDARGQFHAGHCLSTRIMSNMIYIIFLVILALAMRINGSRQEMELLVLAGFIRIVESWADIYLGVLQKNEQMKRWAISQITKTTSVLVWALFISRFTDNISSILVGWLVITVMVIVLYDRVQAGRFGSCRLIWDRDKTNLLIQKGLPLGVFVTLAILNHQVAKYFIAPILGKAQVAYFGALMNFVFGAMAIQNGINQSLLPRLSRYYTESIKEFKRLLWRLLGISSLAMLAGVLGVLWQGEFILRFLYSPEYAQNVNLFFPVVLAGCLILLGMILGDAITACHRFKSRMIAMAAGLAVNILICWLCISRYGLKAAVWAALISSGITTFICLIVLINVMKRNDIAAGYDQGESGVDIDILT
ncbi:MAG: oligosaccharide flippase family protein [Sedimentisphaerales bacterium]|nr:oligosaccharide flippase family protein [Sedimentisphaerales bacterium]